MRKAKRFLINTVILTITSSFLGFIGVSFNVYISNTISNEALGIYQLIMSVYMFSITIATSGINLASTRIVAEELAKGSYSGAKKALKQCVFYSLTLGVLACILLSLFAPIIARYWLHNKITPLPFYIASVSLPFISVSSAINGYFTAMRKAGKTASARFIEQIFTILATVYFFHIFFPNDIEYACIALVLGTCVADIISFLYSYFLYCMDQKNIICGKKNLTAYHKKIFHIAVPIALTSYIRSGLSTLKQMLIPLRLELSGLSCETALAKYGMINGKVMPILMFPSVIVNSCCSLLVPEFSDLNAKHYFGRIHTLISRIFKVTILFSACILGILWCSSKELSLVIYHSIETAEFIKILSPLVVLIYLDNIVDSILKGLDMQLGVMGVNILDLFVSISFIYFLLPVYGIYGYIAVIFISEFLNTSISILQLKRATKFHFDLLNWIIKPLCSIIFANFLTHLFSVTIENIFLKLFLQILLFVIIYILCLVASNCIGKEDIKF